MNPVLVEIYSTVAPSMPFIIGAYALMWVAILVYVLIIMFGFKKAEKQMAVLEEALAEQQGRLPSDDGLSARATIAQAIFTRRRRIAAPLLLSEKKGFRP